MQRYISVLELFFYPFPRAHRGCSPRASNLMCVAYTLLLLFLYLFDTHYMCVQSVCSIDDLKNTRSVSLSSQPTILVPAILSCNTIRNKQSASQAPSHYMYCNQCCCLLRFTTLTTSLIISLVIVSYIINFVTLSINFNKLVQLRYCNM